MYNKKKHYLTLHYGDGVKEYYGTDCMGKLLEVSTNLSNNISERLLNYKDIPKEAFCKIFRTRDCYENSK
jgi:hypothetical protein